MKKDNYSNYLEFTAKKRALYEVSYILIRFCSAFAMLQISPRLLKIPPEIYHALQKTSLALKALLCSIL